MGRSRRLWHALMFRACLLDELCDLLVHLAVRLRVDARYLGDYEEFRLLEHRLLPKRKLLLVAKVRQLLKHVRGLEDIARVEFLGELA